jgi:hypothetical protein
MTDNLEYTAKFAQLTDAIRNKRFAEARTLCEDEKFVAAALRDDAQKRGNEDVCEWLCRHVERGSRPPRRREPQATAAAA